VNVVDAFGMDRRAGGGGGMGEIAREMRVVYRERERDEYHVTTRDSLPLSVYMQGGRG